MKYWFLCFSTLALSTLSHAALEPLDNQALTEVTGQGGADISLELRLNHDNNAAFTCDTNALEFCRIALSINNRFADGSYRDSAGQARDSAGAPIANVGAKQWLVFKGIQGTINIPEIKLDGDDIGYIGKDTSSVVKPVIRLGFSETKPIQFLNVGYASLAIETDTPTEEGFLVKGSGGSGAGEFVNGKYIADGFDQNREVGFTGLNINGNLAMAGTLKIFSCDANHPRC